MKRGLFSFFTLLVFLISGRAVLAADEARLFLSPDSGSYDLGKEFSIEVKMDTGGNDVNAVSAFLVFDSSELKPVGIDSGGSVFGITGRDGVGTAFVEISRASTGAINGVDLLVAKVKFKTIKGGAKVNVDFSLDGSRKTRVLFGGVEIRLSTKGGDYDISGDAKRDTKIKGTPVKGWGWASVDLPAGGQGKGVGWIRLSNDTPGGAPNDPVAYGVYYDSVTGKLDGYAWSGIQCDDAKKAGETCGYGWLSFYEDDLKDCPSGECVAKVDDKGKASGWAKFLAAESGTADGWDGWVNLRGKAKGKFFGDDYGVCFGTPVDPETNKDGDENPNYGLSCNKDGDKNPTLTGWAWGGDIVGWIKFGEIFPAPAVKKLDAVCAADKKAAINLRWSNPVEYDSLEIFRSVWGATEDDLIFRSTGSVLAGEQTVTDTVGYGRKLEYIFKYLGKDKAGKTREGTTKTDVVTSKLLSQCDPPEPAACELDGVRIDPNSAIAFPGETRELVALPVFNDTARCGGSVKTELYDPEKLSGPVWKMEKRTDDALETKNSLTSYTPTGKPYGIYFVAAEALPKGVKDVISAAFTYNKVEKVGRAMIGVERPTILNFRASCAPSETSLYMASISWEDRIADRHSTRLIRTDKSGKTRVETGFTPVYEAAYVTYQVDLKGGEIYNYVLEVTYDDGTKEEATANVGCGVDDTPKIIAVDPSVKKNKAGTEAHSLWVSWTDRASKVLEHVFQIQRLKVTPERAKVEEFRADERRFAINDLRWENKTRGTPFVQKIGRSGTGSPSVERPETEIEVADARQTSATNTNFDYFYSGGLKESLVEGKTYYFSVSSCPYVTGLKELHLVDGVSKEGPEIKDICRYSDLVSYTAKPLAPSGLKATAMSTSQVNVEFRLGDVKKSYTIRRDTASLGTTPVSGVDISAKCRKTGGDESLIKCTDDGLVSDTKYYYRVWQSQPDVEGRLDVFSPPSDEVTAHTHFEVKTLVDASGTGTGSVSGEGDYPKGTSATLTATAAGGSIFESWFGCPNESGSTCSVTGNATVTAKFKRNTVSFTVIIKGGVGGGSVSGPIGCGKTDGNMDDVVCEGLVFPGDREFIATPHAGFMARWSGCNTVTTDRGVWICTTRTTSGGSVSVKFELIEVFLKSHTLYANILTESGDVLEKIDEVGRKIIGAVRGFARNVFSVSNGSGLATETRRLGYDLNNFKGEVKSLFEKSFGFLTDVFAPKSFAEVSIDLEPFWSAGKSYKTGVKDPNGSFDDNYGDLVGNAVYLYRMKVCYTDGGCKGGWSNEAAGLTVSAVTGAETAAGLGTEPTAEIWANPGSVMPGEKTMISWRTRNAEKAYVYANTGASEVGKLVGETRSGYLLVADTDVVVWPRYCVVATNGTVSKRACVTIGIGGGTPPEGGTPGTPEPVTPEDPVCTLVPTLPECTCRARGGCGGAYPIEKASFCRENGVCEEVDVIVRSSDVIVIRQCENNAKCSDVGSYNRRVKEN